MADTLTESPAKGFDPARMERILEEEGLLTSDQIGRARRINARMEKPKSIAQLALELGWISRASLDSALRRRRSDLTIEELLVEKGLLGADAILAAQETVQDVPGRTVIAHLIETGTLTERAYMEVYCEQNDMPFVEADPSLVDPSVLDRVSLRYLSRHRILPLSIRDESLHVLVGKLEGHDTVIADLERIFGCPVTLGLATQQGIDETLAALASGNRGEDRPEIQTTGIQYHQLSDAVESDQASDIVDYIILRGIREGASDIHVEPRETKLTVRFRIDGSMVHVTDYPKSYASSIVSRIKVLAQADVAEHRIHQDGHIYIRSGDSDVDIRGSFYVTVHGENAVLRLLRGDRGIIGLQEMGFAPTVLRTFIEDVLEPSTGIVLVTGPTGSGKTTTLYASVDQLNDSSVKIITCEDPVEYIIDGITQCSVKNRPGINFVDSLKAIVRQDPDVILIGEIRDPDSADMAIQSALTGHKVLSTYHTEDSVGALVRLIDMQIETFLIASTVTAVLAQRLVRRQCEECKAECQPSPSELRALGLPREEMGAFSLTRGRGCSRCHYTGFRGRLGVYELLVMTDPLRDAILQRKPSHELRLIAAEGPEFVHLQEDGIAKTLLGQTTLDEVLANTPRVAMKRTLAQLVKMYD